MSKLIFGCGYLGGRVANLWSAAGETVYVVTRSAERAESLRRAGLKPIVADVTRPASLGELPAVSTVLYAVGFDRSAGRSMHEVYVEGLRHALDALPESTGRVIYISSTSVYGQTDGEWVDESSPCEPERENGRDCLAAERVLRSHPLGSRAVILRLAGIYGPGRIPRGETLKAGEPIAAASEGYLNLIHVADAAQVVLLADEHSSVPNLYLVSDGQPAPRRAYYEELARLLDAPPPRFVAPPEGSPRAARSGSNKRIGNARLLGELPVRLAFPSYREGLAAIVAAES